MAHQEIAKPPGGRSQAAAADVLLEQDDGARWLALLMRMAVQSPRVAAAHDRESARSASGAAAEALPGTRASSSH